MPQLRRRIAAGGDPDDVLDRGSASSSAPRWRRWSAPSTSHELVLSGPHDLLDGPLREAADRTIRARTMPVTGEQLVVRTSTLGDDVVLVGAAVLVLAGQLGVS